MPASSRAPRKTPRQRRSTITVDAILEAATRIFEREGFRRTSTARVAEVAGVSVGSLYQYFPNKLALLAGAKERYLQRLFAHLRAVLGGSRGLEAGLRDAVRATIAATLESRALLRVCAEELPARLRVGEVTPSDSPPVLLVRAHLQRYRRELPHHRPELAALVITELVDGVTRAALHDRVAELQNGTIEQELMRAILLYLRGSRQGEPRQTRNTRKP